MRSLVGLAARGVFWLTALWIVGTAVKVFWQAGNPLFAVGAVVVFPVTYFVFPFLSGMWPILIVSMAAYIISTTVGGMRPVD